MLERYFFACHASEDFLNYSFSIFYDVIMDLFSIISQLYLKPDNHYCILSQEHDVTISHVSVRAMVSVGWRAVIMPLIASTMGNQYQSNKY